MFKKGELFIGTSGWFYDDWRAFFYPKNLPKEKWLEYFASHFRTVELNNSFYRLPKESTFLTWYKKTPENFLFAVKVSRFISHLKRLKDCGDSWYLFYQRAKLLKEKLGPFLIQLPPRWQKNLKRLKNFVKMIKGISPKEKFAFEFRDESWFCPDIFRFLNSEKNLTLCLADSVQWPKTFISSGDFIYIRFHGPGSLYASKYSQTQLQKWAKIIKSFLKEKKSVFCYFNNDFSGFAVENAKELLNLCQKRSDLKNML